MVSTLIVWGPGSLRSTTALETFAARGAAREHQNPLVRKRIAAWVTLRWSSTCVSSMVIFLHMKHQKIFASVHTHTSIYDIWIYAVCKCICICICGMYMYLHVYTHIYICTCNTHTYKIICIHTYALYTHLHTHISIYIHTSIHPASIHPSIHPYIHTYIDT